MSAITTVMGFYGLDSLPARFVLLDAKVRLAAMGALKAAALDIKDEWQTRILTELIAPNGPGGSPDPRSVPAVDYYDSIEVGEVEPVPTGAVVEIRSVIEPRPDQPYSYPVYVEYGTSKMSANPVATRTFENRKEEATKHVRETVEASILETFPNRYIKGAMGRFMTIGQVSV